jgi:CRP-like cAMP-binding protein
VAFLHRQVRADELKQVLGQRLVPDRQKYAVCPVRPLGYHSGRRLARLLLLLANFGTEGSPQPINPHISQETLTEMIGTTRSRVSHFMNKFRKLGFISYNGHIEVHSSMLSALLHEKPQLKEE